MEDCLEEIRPEDITFTRKDLLELRVAMVKKENEDAAKKLAAQVRSGVLHAAMHTGNKTYSHRIGYDMLGSISMFSERYYNIIEDALYSLSRTFPDVAIVYRKIRNDIYVEWS